MTKLFGTDGMRGEAGRFPLDAQTVRRVGSSLALHLREKVGGRVPLIVTGRDTRESGSWLEQSLTQGALHAGAQCRSAGVITTPGIAFLTRTLPADAGVVISASHNPYQDNGVKIFAPSGKKLEDATEQLIEADIRANSGDTREKAIAQEIETAEDGGEELRTRYRDFLADEIAGNLSLEDLTLVVDCANGAATSFAPDLFARLSARTHAINCEPDGRNINRDCGSLHIAGLQRRVLAEHADIGVAFDGDADRSLFVDADGKFVDGDATLWAIARYLHGRNELSHNVVVATVMSNIGLEIALRSRGIRLLRTDVGDKCVLEELLRTGASVGGEQSGHMIFPRLSFTGDGIITSLYLLRAMRADGKTLTELTQGFKLYPQVLVNVKVREKRPFSEVKAITELVRETESRLGDRGRLLLRYSGTEPLARIMIEGESQNEIECYASELASAIQHAFGAA